MNDNRFVPQSVVDDIKEVKRLLGCGYISKETAEKRLEGIEADLRKLQGLVSSAEKTGEATELELPLFDELEKTTGVEWKKLMHGDWIEQKD